MFWLYTPMGRKWDNIALIFSSSLLFLREYSFRIKYVFKRDYWRERERKKNMNIIIGWMTEWFSAYRLEFLIKGSLLQWIDLFYFFLPFFRFCLHARKKLNICSRFWHRFRSSLFCCSFFERCIQIHMIFWLQMSANELCVKFKFSMHQGKKMKYEGSCKRCWLIFPHSACGPESNVNPCKCRNRNILKQNEDREQFFEFSQKFINCKLFIWLWRRHNVASIRFLLPFHLLNSRYR